MNTEPMEVFSLEEGDQIVHHGEIYRITSLENAEDFGIDIFCTDEEGYRRVIRAAGAMDKVALLCDADHN